MEKSLPKTSVDLTGTSFPVDHGMYSNLSRLSRCNSFSSSSNDSAVYCSSNTVELINGNRKRILTNNQSFLLSKRKRNSSGSSMSSNLSCVSDKDSKNSHSNNLINSPPKTRNVNTVSNESRLNYTKSSTDNITELKQKENEKLSCTNNSVISGTQRTLRGKITKKGCTCCPSSHTTVFVRRYQKFSVNTSEEGKVISSTNMKTYVQKKPAPQPNNEEKIDNKSKSQPSKPKPERKRRSEIDKLYESLHEIEWAKNFSPDNILRQINVRQAASCSLFGRPSITIKSKQISKQKRSSNDEKNSVQNFPESDVSKNKNSNDSCLKTKINSGICESNPNSSKCEKIVTENKILPSLNKSKSVNILNGSESSVNTTASSVPCTENVKFVCKQSVMKVKDIDCVSEANNLSLSSDESSSAHQTSIAKMKTKQIVDFNFENKNKDLSDTTVSEYTTTPTFFDIAEEGIRTIDACFREVGAEVVVSTCYEEDESSLPLLTSVRENRGLSKPAQNDTPPILEPCVNISTDQSFKIVCNDNAGKSVKKCRTLKTVPGDNKNHLVSKDVNYRNCIVKNQFQRTFFPRFWRKYVNSLEKSNYNLSVLCAKKRILKKYVKYTKPKVQYESLKSNNDQSSSKVEKIRTYLNNKSCNLRSCKLNHSPVLPSPMSLKSHKVTYEAVNERDKVTVIETNKYTLCNYKDRIKLDYSGKSSCLVEKEIRHEVENGKRSIITKSQTCISQQRPIISSFISSVNNDDKEDVPRPSSIGFSCHYKTITVNRHNNYTQIILKLTRGKSIFLTVEALTELKDVLNRSSHDSSCQVLIINGIGDSFCLGIDLKPLIGPRKKYACTEMAVAIKELIEALADFKKPLAVVVNGPAFGLGMTLLNHADLTIASKEATFCMPYTNLGYIPEGGATLTLPQIVGSTLATELFLNGRTMTAEEACNAGLVTSVVEAKCLPQVLVSRIRELAKNSLSALETTKHMMKMQLHVNLQLVLENEVKLLPCMWLTQTCQDALANALRSGILSE